MDYMMWLQESDSYDTFTSKAAAVAARDTNTTPDLEWDAGSRRSTSSSI